MRPPRFALIALLTLALTPVAACSDQEFVGENGFYVFAISESTPPLVMTDEAALYMVEERILLPLKEPTNRQLRDLERERRDVGDPYPYDRLPWVTRGDYELEVDYLLVNLDDEPRRVDVTINGINEFHEYVPEFEIDDDEIIVEFSQWERSLALEPLERRAGTIREENLDEAAVDLATVVNGVTNANFTVHPNNQHQTDTRSGPFIPEVVPALAGFRAGLRTTEAANIVMELTIRVRDEKNRVISNVDNAWEMPAPAIFLPSSVVPPEDAE